MLKLLGLEVSSRPSLVASSSQDLGQGWLFAESCALADCHASHGGRGVLSRV